MAKFFISNSLDGVEKNKNRNSVFFTRFNTISCGTQYAVTYEKEFNSLGNSYILKNHTQKEDEDFCIVVGTFIFKEKVGEDAVKLLYEVFSPEIIADLKKEIIGIYAVFIHKKGKSYIFNDYYGLYDVCYSQVGDNYYIGNSLSEVAVASGQTEFDDYSLLMELFQVGCFPGKTIFKDVANLRGEEWLTLTDCIEVCTIPSESYRINYRYETEDKALNDIKGWLCKYAKLVDNCYLSEAVFLTGGLDSRMVFGAFNNVNANFNCLYGTGRITEKEDKRLATELCNDYNKKLNILNWSHPEETEPIDWNYQEEVFKKIGFSNVIASGSRNQYESIKDGCKDVNFYAFGYYCEAIRLRDWAADLHRNFFSLDEYIDDYYLSPRLTEDVYQDIKGYRSFLRDNYIKQLNDIGVDDNYDKIPLDKFERFRWKQSRFCDSRMEFFVNHYTYSFSLLSIPTIHEAILSLPAEVIRDGVFQVKLIKLLDKNLIDKYDVFSHMRLFTVNKKNKKIRKLTLKNMGDELFKYLPSVKPFLIKIYRKYRYNNNQTLSEQTIQIGDLSNNIYLPFNYKALDGDLSRLRQFLIGFRFINQNKQ